MTNTPTLPFPVSPRQAGEQEADLFGFTLIHRALRSGCHLLADAVTGIAAGDPCPPDRHRAILWFAGHVLGELHTHHTKEDDILWPVIAVSAGPHVDLEPLTDDHTALHQLLEQVNSAVKCFAADHRSGAVDLSAKLAVLAAELDEHIADEEATVFPVIRTYVSHRDMEKCEKQFQKKATLPHLLFLLPWINAQCTPADLAHLDEVAPAPMKVLLKLVDKKWQRRRNLVAGLGAAS